MKLLSIFVITTDELKDLLKEKYNIDYDYCMVADNYEIDFCIFFEDLTPENMEQQDRLFKVISSPTSKKYTWNLRILVKQLYLDKYIPNCVLIETV